MSLQIPHRIECLFVLHDLRRCFLSRGERIGLILFTLKRLANHSFGRDITAGYIILDLEQLREPMQKITDEFFSIMGGDKNRWNAS